MLLAPAETALFRFGDKPRLKYVGERRSSASRRRGRDLRPCSKWPAQPHPQSHRTTAPRQTASCSPRFCRISEPASFSTAGNPLISLSNPSSANNGKLVVRGDATRPASCSFTGTFPRIAEVPPIAPSEPHPRPIRPICVGSSAEPFGRCRAWRDLARSCSGLGRSRIGRDPS